MSRKIRLGVVAAAALSFVSTQPVAASTATASMSVSATVLSACTVTSTPLAFGNYGGSALSQTSTVGVICTNGTTYTIALSNGTGTGATTAARQMAGTGGQLLAYSIYSDSAHSNVWGSSTGTNTVPGTGNGLLQTISAYGLIPGSQTPSPGLYTDTVTVTLTY